MTGNTEQNILEAAKKVFVKRGFAGARMQEIADEAAINKAMLHYYYRSKEKLFKVILEESMTGVINQFADALDEEGSVLEKIETVVRVYISNLRKQPHLPLFVLHELSQNRTHFLDDIKGRVHHMPNFLLFFQQILKEQQEGIIKAIPPMHLLLNVMSMCVFPFVAKPLFCNFLEIPETQFDEIMEQRIEEVTRFIRNALEL